MVVSMEDKLEAIKRLDRGKMALDYGVGCVTVRDWKGQREEIKKWCFARVSDDVLKDRKTMKKWL